MSRFQHSIRSRIPLLAVALLLCGTVPSAMAQDGGRPRLYTNEHFVEDVTRRSDLDVDDLRAVFAFVVDQLPASMQVYPTENYYYFYFYHNGVRYAGNFRFPADAEGADTVEFIYFKETTDWLEDDEDNYAALGQADGVVVTKVSPLAYRLTFRGKDVTFHLNDLSTVKPPASAVSGDERYLGPVFDESAIRFFLLFDDRLKQFRYTLDEAGPVADEFVRPEGMKHVLVGRRTGFALVEDARLKRRILVGVYRGNVAVNNYLDGPFDQLPDNFVRGDELKDAILSSRPDIEGTIDRFGNYPGGESRVSISPYLDYGSLDDLLPFDRCAAADPAFVYVCLDVLIGQKL